MDGQKKHDYSNRLFLIVSHIRHGSLTVSSPYPKATCSQSSNLLPVIMKREKATCGS